MVALLGFFELASDTRPDPSCREERGAVDALELLVFLVALPVSAGDGEQLERLDLGRSTARAGRGRNR